MEQFVWIQIVAGRQQDLDSLFSLLPPPLYITPLSQDSHFPACALPLKSLLVFSQRPVWNNEARRRSGCVNGSKWDSRRDNQPSDCLSGHVSSSQQHTWDGGWIWAGEEQPGGRLLCCGLCCLVAGFEGRDEMFLRCYCAMTDTQTHASTFEGNMSLLQSL